MRDAQLGCPNPLGWGARHFSAGFTKAQVEEEKASMLFSPMATTPPPRGNEKFSPGTGEKDAKENDSQTGAAFQAIRAALGLNLAADVKPDGARVALTSLDNFSASPVNADPAVVAAQKPDVPQVAMSGIQQPMSDPPSYRAPETFPVVVPPPVLPIAPVAPKPTLTALDPELGAPQANTTTNLGHIELNMPPTLPSPVGSLAELSSIASISEVSTPMAWKKDDVAVEDSWSTLQATLGMGSTPGSARTPANRFEASLLAATAAAPPPPPPPPLQQTPWWAVAQQNPPLPTGFGQFQQYPMAAQASLSPAASAAAYPPAGYSAQPSAWPVGGWGDSMEGHKAALAAAVQASGLGSFGAVQAQPVSVEAEPKAPTSISPHKAAYRRPTDDEISAKLQALQKPAEYNRVDLVKEITDQDIVDRLMKVKTAARSSPAPQETAMPIGLTQQSTGVAAELEGQRIRI
jgi:hypothetical protein